MRRLIVAVVVLLCLGTGRAEDDALEQAQRALLARFEPPPRASETASSAQIESDRAAIRRLRPIEAELTVTSHAGDPLPAIDVVATHPVWDIRTEPARTDDSGRVVIRLPPGAWTVDVSGRSPTGALVLGRFEVACTAPRAATVALGPPRALRVRLPAGRAQQPDGVALATPDLTHRVAAAVDAKTVELVTAPDQVTVVQAWRLPTRRPGYLVRRQVGGALTDIELALERDVLLQVDGRGRRSLKVRVQTGDPLAAPVVIESDARRDLYVSGFEELMLQYEVTGTNVRYGVHAGPVAFDGRKAITGKPDFTLSASFMRNGMSRYRQHRDSLSLRVFLRDPLGLIVRGHSRRAPFRVDWKARVGRRTVAEGAMTGSWRTRLPPMEDDDRARLELELDVRGQGARMRETVAVRESTDVATGEHVICHALPELAENARLWTRWADQLAAAFKESTHYRPRELKLYFWVHAMPGTSGWGGYNSRRSFAMFADGRLFGFVRRDGRNDLTVSHELGHAFGITNHGTYFQALQSRAVRRMKSLRNDEHRIPAGNAYAALLADLPADGGIPAARRAGKAPPPGAVSGVDTQVHEDELVAWYVRSVAGADACVRWRQDWHYQVWWLTLRGFTDDECRAAAAGHATGENLAWLIRLRGGTATHERVAAAMKELREPSGSFVDLAGRRAALRHWARAPLPAADGLSAGLATLAAELGARAKRVDVLLRWAEAAYAAGRRADGERLVFAALAEAFGLGRSAFDARLAEAAGIWARGNEAAGR